jgi:hypothetical protein
MGDRGPAEKVLEQVQEWKEGLEKLEENQRWQDKDFQLFVLYNLAWLTKEIINLANEYEDLLKQTKKLAELYQQHLNVLHMPMAVRTSPFVVTLEPPAK